MSEIAEVNKPVQKRRTTLIITAAIVIVLLLVYVGGMILLPVLTLSNYESGNCGSVLTMSNIYTGIYPTFVQDKTLATPVMECAVFTLAGRLEGDAAWGDSLNTFEVYSNTYPNGLFVKEAHEHSGSVLYGLAKQQAADKKPAEALANLKLILKDFGDTSVSANAVSLFHEVYTTLGTDLRNSGDYEESERILSEFKTWAEDDPKTELAKSAQGELSQTYLAWGVDLQSQKRFEEAKTKFDLAVSSNPGSAEQVQANEETFHREWGDYLIEQKEFAGAMDHYGTAATFAEKRDPAAAMDIMANAYIQWATGLSAEEDFLGALQKVELAGEKAIIDTMKKNVDDARQEVYIAFSKSNGEQAQEAMKDAAAIVCEQHKMPSLPIFGMDQEKFLVAIYGVDELLPKNIVATTPGEMHYIACIAEDSKIVESVLHTESSYFINPNPPYTKMKFQFNRIQYIWAVTLRKVETGKEVESTIVEGNDPPPFPTDPWEIAAAVTNPQYFGPKPDVADLTEWLLLVIE